MKLIQKLQSVQDMAARLLSAARRCQYISSILAALHWLLGCFKVMILTYKALNRLRSQYLAECLLPMGTPCPTHLSQAGHLRMLTPREAQMEKTRNHAFLAVPPWFWNQLPPAIQQAPWLLETCLCWQAFLSQFINGIQWNYQLLWSQCCLFKVFKCLNVQMFLCFMMFFLY